MDHKDIHHLIHEIVDFTNRQVWAIYSNEIVVETSSSEFEVAPDTSWIIRHLDDTIQIISDIEFEHLYTPVTSEGSLDGWSSIEEYKSRESALIDFIDRQDATIQSMSAQIDALVQAVFELAKEK